MCGTGFVLCNAVRCLVFNINQYTQLLLCKTAMAAHEFDFISDVHSVAVSILTQNKTARPRKVATQMGSFGCVPYCSEICCV